MRIIVIGGTGHQGRALVPKLVELGHEVLVATRGRAPAPTGPAWEKVELLTLPGTDAPAFLAERGCDGLIDIVQKQATALYEALRPACGHFIWCGSVWMLGSPPVVPTPEVRFGEALLGSHQRRMDELCDLQRRCRRDGVAFTAILPPNICGPGKVPMELRGGRDVEAHKAMAAGEPVTLPAGCNTLIGPADVEDVVQGYWRALADPAAAAGEFFNVGTGTALTVTEWVEVFSEIYGTAIPIRRVPFEEFIRDVCPDPGANNHFLHHMCPDIAKIRRKLGYQPRYSPREAMARAVEWMRAEGLL